MPGAYNPHRLYENIWTSALLKNTPIFGLKTEEPSNANSGHQHRHHHQSQKGSDRPPSATKGSSPSSSSPSTSQVVDAATAQQSHSIEAARNWMRAYHRHLDVAYPHESDSESALPFAKCYHDARFEDSIQYSSFLSFVVHMICLAVQA